MKIRPPFWIALLVATWAQGQAPSTSSKEIADSHNANVRELSGIHRSTARVKVEKLMSGISVDSSRALVDEALNLCKSRGNDTTFILLSTLYADFLNRVGEKDLAHRYLITARALTSEQSMIPFFRNHIYIGLYFIHYWYYTRYDSAVYYGLLSVDLAAHEAKPDSLTLADRNIIVGAAYNKMGDNIQALEHYRRAESLMINNDWYPQEYCYLYNQLGTLYFDEGDLNKAEQYYLSSVAKGRIGGGFPRISPMTNLANVYDLKGEYDKALKYLDSAEAVFPDANDPWRVAAHVRNKGRVLAHAGRPREGIVETQKAMAMYARLKDDYSVARMHCQLAEPYRMLGDYKTAEREALQALEWDRKNGYGELVKESFRQLSLIYAATNQYGKAFDYQTLYFGIVDSLNSTVRRDKFNQLETSFQFAAQEKVREDLQRKNEVYLAEARAEKTLRIYFIVGTTLLAGAVIAAVIAYRRTRSQNIILNQQNKKIEDQSRQLQEAAKMKSRFFTNVSHELRTPVTLLNGMLELMRDKPAHNGTHEKLEIALNSSRRLQGMLNEVLDLSRIEDGRWELSLSPREILPLLNRIVTAFESLMIRKEIKLEYQASDIAGLWVDLDEDKFEKVINNLIYNAIKFNKPGGLIKISAGRTERTIVIQVTDSGIGIPQDELPFIFDRFYQSAATEKLNSQGVGIGLSLVREFTEMHGGKVSVTSTVAEGSSFTVELPIATTDDGRSDVSEVSADIPDVGFGSFARRPLVLIVEDNEEMRYYLKQILGDHVTIAEAGHGREALEWLKHNMPDLIISDVMMPEMDGHEFLVQLKGSMNYRGIPVIMLTARASEEDLLHGLSLGVDDYIIKPFSSKELKIRVHNLLTNQEIRREWREKPEAGEDAIEPSTPGAEQSFREKVTSFVETHAGDMNLSVAELSDHLAMSERQLYRKAATFTGFTPSQLMKEIRLKMAYRILLARQVVKVAELAKSVGFENTSYFSRQFEERFGKRPTEFL